MDIYLEDLIAGVGFIFFLLVLIFGVPWFFYLTTGNLLQF